MCTTAFKKLCRKQGVMQWPHRTLRSLEKKIASLRAEQKFTNDHNQIDEQVRKLQMKREAILSGTGLANLDGDDLITSPSDDSSSTAASGSSSPRSHSQGPHDVLNALALDDSSSVGSSSSLSEDRHAGSSASSTGSLTARREGGSREAAEYPQMPGEGMLGSEQRGQWDKRAFHMAPGGRGHEEEESQMSRDPFDTLSHVHDAAGDMMHRMRGSMSMARGRMHGHEGAVPEDLAHQHEAHRRVAPGPMGFNPSGGLGMHPADAMHMGGRRYPSGMGMHAGGMGGHMMWYKDQHRGMPLRDGGHQHPGAEGGFYMGGGATGMAGGDHAASSARLQQQVSYLLAENHNLRMVIRSMSQEREEFSRKSEGLFSFFFPRSSEVSYPLSILLSVPACSDVDLRPLGSLCLIFLISDAHVPLLAHGSMPISLSLFLLLSLCSLSLSPLSLALFRRLQSAANVSEELNGWCCEQEWEWKSQITECAVRSLKLSCI